MAAGASWGIEVGSASIAAIKLEAKGDNLALADFVVIPHKRVLSTPDTDPADVVRITLGMLANRVDLSGGSVAMSIPGHSGFARFATLPPVDPKKVHQIVAFEAKQQIPFPLEEVEWDYQTFVSPESPDVEVGIFAVTREKLSEQLRLWSSASITPDMITLSPLAAYNALAYDMAFGDKTPGTIIVDIGTTSTDLIVSEPGRAWVRTFPIGGHHFTLAIAETFNLSYAKAEKLKKEFETTKHAKHVMQAMKEVFHDLAQDIQRSIGYYQSLHSGADLQRVIGIGSTFRIPGLQRYLKQQLQMNVSRVEGFQRISVDSARATEFADASLNLVTAYGLALQGIDEAALVANLMPSTVLKTSMWKRKVPWFGVAAGLSLAATAAMFIRPTLDRIAVNNNRPPAIISQVINSAQLNKSEASEVISAVSDFSAVNMLALIESLPVYENLTNDLALMLEDADVKAIQLGLSLPTGMSAFQLTSYKTTFHEAGTETDFDAVTGEPIEPAKARVDVEITLTSVAPNARDLVVASIDAWLRNNKDRSRVPYTISWDGRESWKTVGRPEGVPVVDASGESETGQRRVRPPGTRRNAGPKMIVIGENNPGKEAARSNESLEGIAPLKPEDPGFTEQTRRTEWSVKYTATLRVEQQEQL